MQVPCRERVPYRYRHCTEPWQHSRVSSVQSIWYSMKMKPTFQSQFTGIFMPPKKVPTFTVTIYFSFTIMSWIENGVRPRPIVWLEKVEVAAVLVERDSKDRPSFYVHTLETIIIIIAVNNNNLHSDFSLLFTVHYFPAAKTHTINEGVQEDCTLQFQRQTPTWEWIHRIK